MKVMQTSGWSAARVALAAGMAGGIVLTGCGTPGAPLPPSLKLPDPVTNLSASRTGNQVSLAWIMPKKNTDKLLIEGNIPVHVCRKEDAGACVPVPGNLSFAAGTAAAFTETLPQTLSSGPPRPVTYFVELLSPHGRSAGPSNGAHFLAGEAPAPVTGLSAQLRKDGVVLHWTPVAIGDQPSATFVIRLHRTLLTHVPATSSAAKSTAQPGIFAPPKELDEQSLLVDSPGQLSRTIDKTIRFGRTYEYRIQRVARIAIDSQTVELSGPISDPVRVEAIDVFPPAVPSGLAAVATAADSTAGPSIDLSWLPIPEADLAGYAVYRREGEGEWQRISPAQPNIGPAFHDAKVQPGHTYRYAVTAIDQGGHESARSPESEETVPNP